MLDHELHNIDICAYIKYTNKQNMNDVQGLFAADVMIGHVT